MILIIVCSFITLCSFATGQTSRYYNRIKKQVEQIAVEFSFQFDSLIVFSDSSRHLIINNKDVYDKGNLLGLEIFQGRTVNDTLIFEKFDETDANLPCTFTNFIVSLCRWQRQRKNNNQAITQMNLYYQGKSTVGKHTEK